MCQIGSLGVMQTFTPNQSMGHRHGAFACCRLYTVTIFPNDQFWGMPTACVCGLVFRFAKAAFSASGRCPFIRRELPSHNAKAALSASGRCPFIRWELSSRNVKAALSADERAAFEMWKHCRWRAKDELRSRHGLPMGLLTLYLAYSMMNFTMRSCEAPPLPVWPLVSVTFVALTSLMV